MKNNNYFVLFILFIMIFGIFGCSGGGDDSNPTNLLSQAAAVGTIQGKLAGANNAGVLVVAEKLENGKTSTVTQFTSPAKAKHAAAPVYSAITDNTGGFLIENVPEGEYFIQARQGSATVGQKMNVAVKSYAVTNLNIQITPTASVTGHVYLSDTSDYSKTVVYFEGTSYIAVTDYYGNFTITNVPVGTGYNLIADGGDEYTNQTVASVEVIAPLTTIADITLMAAPVAPVNGNISGKVIDTKGNIITNANVSLSGTAPSTTTTDGNGDFSFGNIPVGNYQLSATIAGMNTMVMPNISIDDNNYLINGIVLILTPQNVPKGNLDGSVLTKNNNSPILGASVYLMFNNTEIDNTTTDSIGHYSFSNIDEGIYTIRAVYSGFEQTDIIGHVVGGQSQTLSDIKMEPMHMLPYIKGLIKFAFNGQPVVSANVDLYDISSGNPVYKASTFTNQSGDYGFQNLMNGDYYISTEVSGYGFATVEVPVTNTGVIVPTMYIRPQLQSLIIKDNKNIALSFGESYNLDDIFMVAQYIDGSSIKVKPSSWAIVDSPDGSIAGNIYTSGSSISDDIVQASYSENGITVNAQVNIHTGTEAFVFSDGVALYFINNNTVEARFSDYYSEIKYNRSRDELIVSNKSSNTDAYFFDVKSKTQQGYFMGPSMDTSYGVSSDGNYLFATDDMNDEIYRFPMDIAHSNPDLTLNFSPARMGFGIEIAPYISTIAVNSDDTKLIATNVASTNHGISIINLDNFSLDATIEIANSVSADFIPNTNYALINCGTNGVKVLNLDDYTSYEVSTTTSAEVIILSPNGDKAFIYNHLSTQIDELDISNPATVSYISTYDFSAYTSGGNIQAVDFNLDGSAFYLACVGGSGIVILRADPTNPLGNPQTVFQDNTIFSINGFKVVPASKFNPYANGI